MTSLQIDNIRLNVPDEYTIMQSKPSEPDNSVPLCFKSETAMCFIIIYPISSDQAMPYSLPQAMIATIHSSLEENQGLVEVDSLNTSLGRRMIYNVIKTKRDDDGTSYTLMCNIEFPDKTIMVQGFFEEYDCIGERENSVFEFALEKGLIYEKNGKYIGWERDPYNPKYVRGFLKNLAEDQKFDEMFPSHPLSILNDFKQSLADIN